MQVVLLVNLGSPNELKVAAIRRFLRRFLSDKRVVNLPRIIWYPILYGIILPIRASRLIGQYREIWLNEQSPLVYYTKSQQQKLQNVIQEDTDSDTVIAYAFSYSNPDISEVLGNLHQKHNIEKLTVLPLYPQFSSTTTSAVFDQIAGFYASKKYLPQIQFIRSFYENDNYILAVANSIAEHFAKHGKPQKLVFSYHSLPVKIIQDGDSYYDECMHTTQLIAAKLNLHSDDYITTFQSRFGGGKWIAPVTADTICHLANTNTKHIALICPGFISDCLETLEEINVTNRNIFMNNGGNTYEYIPCLNDSNQCIDLLYSIVKE